MSYYGIIEVLAKHEKRKLSGSAGGQFQYMKVEGIVKSEDPHLDKVIYEAAFVVKSFVGTL